MAYKVVEQDKNFHVMEERKLEKAVELVKIKTFSDRQEAKLFMRKLNGGIGFGGWTPDFFLVGVFKK
jgi:hypothetical protein